MNILITGASGFIGLPIASELAKQNHQILAISRSHLPIKHTNIRHLVLDLSNFSNHKQSIRNFNPEVIIHLAWQGIPDFSLANCTHNLTQSIYFLNFVLSIASCQKILVSGSCFEFNQIQGECLESDVGSVKDDFTWAKHSLRLWLTMVCQNRNIILAWLRIFYAYGPRQRPASLIPTILRHLKNNQLPPLKTPNNANDYIHIDDLATAFVLACEQPIKSGLYNLGSGYATSVLTICTYAEQIINNSDKLSSALAKQHSNIGSINFWAQTKATKQRLNWQPKVGLIDGITQTWRCLKAGEHS